MKIYRTYKVTFRWYDTDTFCTNIAKGCKEDIEAHYNGKGHTILAIKEATIGEELEAERKGMPIVKI